MDLNLKMTALSKAVNRNRPQLEMLLNLCDGDFNRLMMLEQRIKERHMFFCPSTKIEVDRIMNMEAVINPWKDIYKDYIFNLSRLNDNI